MEEKTEMVIKLQEWLESLGCFLNPKIFYPHQFENNLLGMITTQPLNPCEILTQIPQAAIFSTELLQSSPLHSLFSQFPETFSPENPEFLDNQFLTLFLHEYSQPASKWERFFAVLPKEIENLCDWTESELSELQDFDLLEDVKIRVNRNKNSYEKLFGIINSFSEFFPRQLDLQEIEWCWKVIWTRSFMRSPEHSALVPYSDLINHGESETSFYFSDQIEEVVEESEDYDEVMSNERILKLLPRDLYEINFSAYENPSDVLFECAKTVLVLADRLEKEIKKKKTKKTQKDVDKNASFIVAVGKNEKYEAGQQVVFEYGEYSNTSLLIHYGFALENNRHEFFRMKIKISDVFRDQQIKYMPLKYDPEGFLLFLINGRSICVELLTVLRAALWNLKYEARAFFEPVCLGLELKVLKRYLGMVQKVIERFETSLFEDLKIEARSMRHRFAVRVKQIIYRVNKKRVLETHLGFVKEILGVVYDLKHKKQSFSTESFPKESQPYFALLLPHFSNT